VAPLKKFDLSNCSGIGMPTTMISMNKRLSTSHSGGVKNRVALCPNAPLQSRLIVDHVKMMKLAAQSS